MLGQIRYVRGLITARWARNRGVKKCVVFFLGQGVIAVNIVKRAMPVVFPFY